MSTNDIRAQEGFNPLPEASANSHEPLNQSPQAAGTTPAPKPNGHDPAPPPEPPPDPDA